MYLCVYFAVMLCFGMLLSLSIAGVQLLFALFTQVEYDHGSTTDPTYELCIMSRNIKLPPSGVFGMSAATGGLAGECHGVGVWVCQCVCVGGGGGMGMCVGGGAWVCVCGGGGMCGGGGVNLCSLGGGGVTVALTILAIYVPPHVFVYLCARGMYILKLCFLCVCCVYTGYVISILT